MNVIYTSSDAYAKCAGVSLYSLLVNNKDVDNIDIYILTTDMSLRNREKITKLCDDFRRKVMFIDATSKLEKAQKELNLSEYRGGLNTYARALANQLLPDNLKNALFIDSDTLVVGSLKELESLTNNNAVISGVIEIMLLIKDLSREDPQLLDMCPNYLNCGVVYINLEKWRKNNGDRKIAKCVQHYKTFKVAEQSILNFTFRESVNVLPPKYNFYTVMHGISYGTLIRRYQKRTHFTEDEFCEATKNPVILHFVGDYWIRPWYKNNDCYYKDVYYEYYLKSPWGDEALDDAPQYSLLFRMYFCFLRCIKKISNGELYFLFRYKFMEWIHEKVPQIDALRNIDRRI